MNIYKKKKMQMQCAHFENMIKEQNTRIINRWLRSILSIWILDSCFL